MEYQKDHDIVITKLTIKDKPAYIKIVWKNNESDIFSIQIFYEDNSWAGCFTYATSEKYRRILKETNEIYISAVKECLTKESPMFKYDFVILPSTNNKKSATFSWKKLYEGSSAVRVHGSVEVEESMDTKNSLIDSLLQENQLLKNNLENIRNKNDIANCELEKYQNELEKIIILQSSMEDTLYSKFTQVLNTKKRRIQILEDSLNNIENI